MLGGRCQERGKKERTAAIEVRNEKGEVRICFKAKAAFKRPKTAKGGGGVEKCPSLIGISFV